MCNDKKNYNRRDFFQMGSMGVLSTSSAVKMLISGLTTSMATSAFAGVDSVPRNYVHIGLDGGAPRYNFDAPLNPYGPTSDILGNLKTANRLFNNDGTTATNPYYDQTQFNINGESIKVPYFWKSLIPKSDGTWVEMSALLQNMVMFRGVDLGQDGHPNNYNKQIRPLGSGPSICGSVSDAYATMIASVKGGSSSPKDFKSNKGYVNEAINMNSPMESLLDAFLKTNDALPADQITRRKAMTSISDLVWAEFNKLANTRAPASDDVFTLRKNSQKTLDDGLGAFQAEYNALYTKYAELMKRATDVITYPLAGLTESTILPSNYGAPLLKKQGSTATFAAEADMRDILHFDRTIKSAYNAKTLELAKNFAVAEFLLKNGYTRSIVFGMPAISWGWDEHDGAAIPSVLYTALTFRVMNACLYEFNDALSKATDKVTGKNLFEETVIHIGGDFNRTPRSDGTGSDHGFNGGVTTIISGAVKAPLVIGNIYRLKSIWSSTTNYDATWGYCAPTNINGVSRNITMGNVSSSITKLLRVPAIIKNDSSLIAEDSNGVSNTVEKAKLVA